MTRTSTRLLVSLLAMVAAACANVGPSVEPASVRSALPSVPAGDASGPAAAKSGPAPPAALPEPNPAEPAANGWVAYVESGALRFASPDGRAIVDGPGIGPVSCPAFAPVGNLLAYRQDVNLVIAAIDERAMVDAQLTLRRPRATQTCPEWSPDGRAIAESVAGEFAAPSEIVWIVSLDGSRRRVHLPGNGWSPWVAWAHDGSSIMAARGSKILLVPLDSGKPRVIYETETSAYGGQDYYAALESSPAGPYFAVIVPCHEERSTAEAESSCLRVVGLDGNVVFEEVMSEHVPPTWHSYAWSPDGTQVAWFARDGMRIRSLDAKEPLAISFEENVEGASSQVGVDWPQGLAWSPDGKRLLCEVSYTGERHEHAIVSVAADGSGDVIVHSGWQTETALLGSGDLTWQRR